MTQNTIGYRSIIQYRKSVLFYNIIVFYDQFMANKQQHNITTTKKLLVYSFNFSIIIMANIGKNLYKTTYLQVRSCCYITNYLSVLALLWLTK